MEKAASQVPTPRYLSGRGEKESKSRSKHHPPNKATDSTVSTQVALELTQGPASEATLPIRGAEIGITFEEQSSPVRPGAYANGSRVDPDGSALLPPALRTSRSSERNFGHLPITAEAVAVESELSPNEDRPQSDEVTETVAAQPLGRVNFGNRKVQLVVATLIVVAAVSLSLALTRGGDSGREDKPLGEQSATPPRPTQSTTSSPTITQTSEPTPGQTPSPTSVSTQKSTGPALWVPVGGDVTGEFYSGTAVALSGDGTLIATGNTPPSNIAGKVEVYQLVGNIAWVPATTLKALDTGDWCCRAVSMSTDGTTIAFGSPRSDKPGAKFSGRVDVYRFDGSEWKPFGSTIEGKSATGISWEGGGERFGSSVSLSGNGNVVAVGAPYFQGEDDRIGQVRVYRMQSGDWKQVGQNLTEDGEYEYGQFGSSVSISSDGLTLAAGAPEYDSPYDHAGQVQVFTLQSDAWVRIGDALPGEGRLDRSGWSVALSGDASTVAIGAPGNDVDEDSFEGEGHVRVYRNFNLNWRPIGGDIDGYLKEGELGKSVAISYDGNIVAVGAPGAGTGYAQVYRLSEKGNWEQVGDTLKGEYDGEMFGASIAMSKNGNMVAVGGPQNQEGRDDPNGHVRIFRMEFEE